MSKPVPMNGLEGVNLLADPTALKPNELVTARNLFPHKPGILGTRKAMSFQEPMGIRSFFSDETSGGTATPQWVTGSGFNFSCIKTCSNSSVPGVSFVAVISVTSTGSPFGDDMPPGDYIFIFGSFQDWGFNFSTIPLTRRGNYPYCIVNVGQRTLILDGGSSGYVVAREGDAQTGLPYIDGLTINSVAAGITLSNDFPSIQRLELVGVQPEELHPISAIVRGNRVVFGAPTAATPNTIIFGDPIDQISTDSWRTVGDNAITARGFVIGSDNEGGLTALWSAAMAPVASLPAGTVYMFKKSSIYSLTGEPGLSTDATPDAIRGTLQITRLNTNAGCVAPNTLQWSPNGLLWLGYDDVWCMSVGNVPERVGSKLQPIWTGQPSAQVHRAHAAYYDGIYRLAVYSDGQGPSEDSPCGDQWWLDLRFTDEQPQTLSARWFGPQQFVPAYGPAGTTNLFLDNRPNYPQTLLSATLAVTIDDPDTGTDAGTIPVICSFDSFNSYDAVLPTQIFVEWAETHAYAEGEILTPKAYAGLEFVCVTAGTSDNVQPNWSLLGSGTFVVTDGTAQWIVRANLITAFTNTYVPPLMQTGSILFDLQSREGTEPDAEKEKLLDGLDLVWNASNPITMEITLSPDFYRDQRDVGPLQTLPAIGGMLPMTMTSQFTKRFIAPDPSRRLRSVSYQVRMTQSKRFAIPYELGYWTIMIPAGGWAAYPIFGDRGSLNSAGAGYTGTFVLGDDRDPVSYDDVWSAVQALVSVLSGLGFPVSFEPAAPSFVPGGFGSGTGGAGSHMNVPGNHGQTFDGHSSNELPADIREYLFASNRFWLSLMGYNGILGYQSFDSGAVVPSSQGLPSLPTAILRMKQFAPRVRVFNRQPT